MREPIVKFYKSFEKGGNGAFAITTRARSADEFLSECAAELESVVNNRQGDLHFTFANLLPQICALWTSLQDGEKAKGVFERRMLVIGDPIPEASMTLISGNVPEPAPVE